MQFRADHTILITHKKKLIAYIYVSSWLIFWP